MSVLPWSDSAVLPPTPSPWHGAGRVSFANLAPWDRWLRILLGAVLLLIGWWGDGNSLGMVALRIFGCLPVLTGLLGWSPLYSLLEFSTRRQARKEG